MVEHEKYKSYTFDDFLQDDYFIESIKRPSEKSVSFWYQFLESFPEQVAIFLAAQKFLEDLVCPQLSEEGVADIWINIQMKINSARIRVKRRKIVFISAAVAASIAMLMFVRVLFFGYDTQPVRDDIISFANNQPVAITNSGEIQLILSEQKTVVLQDKESVIKYDSAGIQTNTVKISKNDVASYNQLIIPHGKSSVLILHDGTKIWVNAGTKLVYPAEFEKDKREIYVNGEVFLDVAPDTQRPFIVRTNDLRIQVIGTKFNVQAYASDEQSRIALESGLVQIISEATDDVFLSPNKIFELDKSGHSSVKDADISKYTSWIHGLYMYESERLEVILKRLERYYGIEISVDTAASEFKCTGKLDLKENVEDVLSIISKTAPVMFIKESEKYVISYQPKKNMPMSQ